LLTEVSDWRTQGGAEVDLLLERDGRWFSIEIKGRTKVSRADTRGIQSFLETYPNLDVAPGLVISLCESMEKLSGTDYALPWDLG